MNLIRKFKISKLTSVEFNEKEKEIIEFINFILSDLIPFKYELYQESMFYMNSEGKWLLEQDNKNDMLWVRYDDFWGVLDKKYLIEYDDIQYLLKYMIEQAFKEKVSTPLIINNKTLPTIEQAFKEKVSTPRGRINTANHGIEQAFKEKVSTPIMDLTTQFNMIEQAFKEKVSTPSCRSFAPYMRIEEAFKENLK